MVLGPDGAPYVLDRLDEDGLSRRPQDEEGDRRRPGRPEGQRRDGRDAAVPRRRRPRPAHPRRQEPALALAAGRRRRARARSSGCRSTAPRRGATTSSAINTFLRTQDAQPLQPLRRRSVRAADPVLRAGRPTAAASRSRRPTGSRRPRRVARSTRRTSMATSSPSTAASSSGSSAARAKAGTPARPEGHAPAAGADLLAGRLRGRQAEPARSTRSTRRTPGCRPRQGEWHVLAPSTGSPAAPRTGRTCAAMYVVPGADDEPPTLIWMSQRRRSTSRSSSAGRRTPGASRRAPGRVRARARRARPAKPAGSRPGSPDRRPP